MDAILTNYPLSRDFQERLESIVSPDAVKVRLTDLQRQPVMQMLKYLRSLRVARLLLPLEDENSSALLPILKLISSAIPADRVYLVAPDLKLQQVSRWEAFAAGLRLAKASAGGRLAVYRAQRECAKLLALERSTPAKPAGRDVLYLNANLWFGLKAGGSVGHISGVINGLLKEGCDVEFVSAGGRLMVNPGAQYEELRPPTHFGFPPEVNHYRFHFDVVKQLKRIVKGRHFDFIYQRLSIANYSGVVLSRLLGIPLVLEYNGSEVWVAKNWGRALRTQAVAEQLEAVNLRHAHLIVTISDVLRDELIARGIDASRIVTYPNCIDPEIFEPGTYPPDAVAEIRKSHGIAPDATVVSFMGTFGQWHGAEILALAIAQLLDNDRAWIEENKVRFLLVGDGLRMSDVRKALGPHANGQFVTLPGLVPQRQAPVYLAASDILCSPHVCNADGSRFFGSPTKLFEYMAMAKGIIASDLDQIGAVLQSSVRAENLPTGGMTPGTADPAVLCRPGNVEDIARSIKFLVERPEWRQALGANARVLALQKYTWAHHVRAILSGLEQLPFGSGG